MASKITRRPQQMRSVSASTPAPVKGINTVDPLAATDPQYALSAQNWIATPQGLSIREGFRKWATGLPTIVTSLFPYHCQISTSNKLFAVSGGAIYDVTTGGTAGAPVVSGLSTTSTYWQYAMQTASTATMSTMFAVNGADAPRMYDGTSWTTCTQVTTPSAPGQFATVDNNGVSVNIANFCDVILHQQRLWFVSNNSTRAYYTDIATSGGKLYAFDFGSLFPRGGKLFKLASWTMDIGGSVGTQAMLVAISDKGDVAVYYGNNPATANTWALQAQYQIGSPVGRRCTAAYQGDLMILSQDGLYPLSKYLQSSRLDSTAALTYTIGPTISDIVTTLSTTPGFELAVYPGQNVMLLNVPQAQQANNFQFCFHTITKGWTQFTGIPAQCFGLFNDSLYFGGPGYVALSFIGYQDGADINGNNGSNIIATAMTAFTAMEDLNLRGRKKHVKSVKPYVVTGMANPTIRVGVNSDFTLTPIVGSATLNPATGAVWDNAKWDDPSATWVGSLTTYNQWATPLSYPGTFLAFTLSISATSQTTWAATDWVLEPGGIFG